MTKIVLMAFVLGVAGCAEFEDTMIAPFTGKDWNEASQVSVWGRTWAVSRSTNNPLSIKAVRDNNNLNPFGKPVKRRTIQAIHAIEQGTRCKVVRHSIYQNVSAEFFATVICK